MSENEATRMRDAGRSWTEISDRLGIPIQEAKARVEEDKKARREALSQTPAAEDRNGLRDPCSNCAEKCSDGSMRKNHEDFIGACESCDCDEYVYHKRQLLPWHRLPKDVDPQYVDPDVNLSSYVSRQARQLGVQKKIGGNRTNPRKQRPWVEKKPEFQQPSLTNLVRRARKKLKAGKPVKKHFDRPKRYDR